MVAVKAVLYHNLDHLGATIEQKRKYHEFCKSSFCEFREWEEAGKPLEKYARTKSHKELDGTLKTWTGGYLKEIDTKYPDAFEKLKQLFATLGSEELMKRCTKKYTQNGNESIHSKLWRIVIKFKSHSTERYNFACQMVMMFHNFGHVKASLLNVLDCMTLSSANFLKNSDNDSLRVAKRDHQLIEGGSRKKHRTKSVKKPGETYEAGCEPIVVLESSIGVPVSSDKG